jgi:poly(A) polymerase
MEERLRPWFSPMSSSMPTPGDEACTKALEEFLDLHDPLETKEETAKREIILLDLRKMTSEWVKSVLMKKGVAEEDAKPGQLFVSGSYRLGVAQKNADVDTILVVPSKVEREDFFSEDPDSLLARLRKHTQVTHILPIPTAAVPLIEVTWSGIDLDVLFAGLNQPHVPKEPDELLDDNLLLDIDYASVLSLNGPRVTELLIKLVPKYPTFCLILRALRFWAKRRGVYSNKLGFLGGVNFAILACFAQQLWPNETASRSLAKLIFLVDEWKWPTPIRLCHSYELPGTSDHLRPWDASSYTGMKDKFPLITPAVSFSFHRTTH